MATRGERHSVARLRRLAVPSLVVALIIVLGGSAAAFATKDTTPTTRSASATTSTVPTGSSTSVVKAPASSGLNGPSRGLATPITLRPTRHGPLSGKVIAIDPGHDGGNYAHTSYIDALVWNGREREACDTTGTATDAGYTEAQFNWNVATYLVVDLRRLGATVVLTRSSNITYGPCITRRAAIGNRAHAAVAISIHADGGPPTGRGFAILTPVADGINNKIVHPSLRFARALRTAFLRTSMPVSTYDGVDAIQPRNDLGGTNLSTVPKVFLECGNMRNATDASLLIRPRWQREAATAIAEAMLAYLKPAR
jgi:N-acetylmuramoyl-L-alanine amidase